MPIGASIAGTVGGAIVQGSAASNASKQAQKAANANLAFQKGVYNTATNNLQPTINEGLGAGSELGGLLNLPGFDAAASNAAFNRFRDSTNYNFLFNQGTNAVKTANAPSFDSGATAKALINYGQGMAGNALSGYEGMLQGQQSLGAQSALGLGGLGVQIGQQNAAANNSAAGANGAAGIIGANAFTNALTGITQGIGQQRTQSSFTNPNTYAGSGGGSLGGQLASAVGP